MNEEQKKTEQKCRRCSRCCLRGDFWEDTQIGKFLLDMGISFKHRGRCKMLKGKKTCLLEKHFGREAKPEVCREYDCGRKK